MARSLAILSRAALGVSIAFCIATSIFCCWTVRAASSSRCAGQEMLQGYRSNLSDLLALPFFSLFIVVMIALWVWKTSKSEYVDRDWPALFEFGRIRLTDHTIGQGFCLLLLVGISGVMVIETATRYDQIWAYCQTVR